MVASLAMNSHITEWQNNSRSGSVKSESEFAVGRSSERLSGGAQNAEDIVGDSAAAADETSDDILAKYRKKATNRLDNYETSWSFMQIYVTIRCEHIAMRVREGLRMYRAIIWTSVAAAFYE